MQKIITYAILIATLSAVLLFILSRTAFSDLPNKKHTVIISGNQFQLEESIRGEPVVSLKGTENISTAAGYALSYDRLFQSLLWIHLARGTFSFFTGDTTFKQLDATILRLFPETSVQQLFDQLSENQKNIIRNFHQGFINGWNERKEKGHIPFLYHSHHFHSSSITETDWLRVRLVQSLMVSGLWDKSWQVFSNQSAHIPNIAELISKFYQMFWERLPRFALTRQIFMPQTDSNSSFAIFELNTLPFLTWNVAFPQTPGDTLRIIYNAGDPFPKGISFNNKIKAFSGPHFQFTLSVKNIDKKVVREERLKILINEHNYFWTFRKSYNSLTVLAEDQNLFLTFQSNLLSTNKWSPTLQIRSILNSLNRSKFDNINSPIINSNIKLQIFSFDSILTPPQILSAFPSDSDGIDLFSHKTFSLRNLIPPFRKSVINQRTQQSLYNALVYDSVYTTSYSFQPIVWTKLLHFWYYRHNLKLSITPILSLDLDSIQFTNDIQNAQNTDFNDFLNSPYGLKLKSDDMRAWFSAISPHFRYIWEDPIIEKSMIRHPFNRHIKHGLGPGSIWTLGPNNHLFCTVYQFGAHTFHFKGPWTEQINDPKFWKFNE